MEKLTKKSQLCQKQSQKQSRQKVTKKVTVVLGIEENSKSKSPALGTIEQYTQKTKHVICWHSFQSTFFSNLFQLCLCQVELFYSVILPKST